MYKIGDYIVKSVNGVCEVADIVEMSMFGNEKKKYYQLIPVADMGARLYVPVDRTDGSLRPVMTEAEARNLIIRIPEIEESWISNEKERERNYKEAVQSSNPERLIGVIKLIYQRKKTRQQQGKKTTAVDGRYFDTAEKLLYSELEFAMKKNKNEIHELIRKCCESA